MPVSPSTTASVAELRHDLGVVAYERLLGSAAAGHIGLQVLPLFRSAISSAKFPRIPKDVGLKAVDDARGAGGHYNEIDWRFEMSSFDTEDRGLVGYIDDRLRALYSTVIEVEQATTDTVTDQILMAHERRVADLAIASVDNAAAVPWNTAATATPKADIDTAKAAFRTASGLLPNALAMSLTAFWALVNTTEVKTALQYTAPIQMGGFEAQRAAMAAYLGVDQILVAGGMKDTTQKNKAAVLADIWNPAYVHLLRLSNGSTNALEPCWGRTILWTGGAADMLTVETYRDEPRRADAVRVRNDYCLFVQYAVAKYTLNNIIA
jgi:hypothetical protein